MVVDPSLPLKAVQSEVEIQPACRSLAVRHDSVLPANESPEPIEALVTGDVPFPVKMPPSVVLPVPPKLTASVDEPTTFPTASVVRSDEVMDVRYVLPVLVKSVVLACVKKGEEAMIEAFSSHRPVVVELTVALAYESIVHGQVIPVPVKVIGEEPSTLKDEHESEPAHVALVVATVPSEFAPVQYASSPTTGADEVPMPRESKTPVVLVDR